MKVRFYFLVFGSLLLSGCGGVVDWAKETFSQGELHQKDKKVLQENLRSKRVYDQFTTVAIFDALWLSDDIKTLYANTYAAMYGRSDEVRKTFLRRQLKANDEFISFYILSTHEVPLNKQPAEWVLYLKVGGNTYSSNEVKAVELSSEYEMFFGKKLTNHKRAYEVRFDRKDTEGKDILNEADTMELYFSSPVHYTAMQWKLREEPRCSEQGEEDETSNRS